MHDLRYAVRLLLRSPGFTLVAVIVLALGIGANSAIFSVVDAVLLRPLPFHNPDRLAMVWEYTNSHRNNRVSPLNYQDWHDQNSVFSSMAAISGNSPTLITPAGPEQLPGQAVTSEFFSLLGIAPIAGRAFTAEDERTQADIVMIGENLWRTHFAADPHIAGRAVTLSGKPFRIAGVVPRQFQFSYASDIWTLFTVKRDPQQRRPHYLQVVGRLKPGVSMSQAAANMASVGAHIAEVAPFAIKDWGVAVQPLRESMVSKELRATSLVLAGVVGFVLLMACVNLANLMLARGAARSREMAVRISLGAPVPRLIRQLLIESLLLAAIGDIAGLALAAVLIRIAPAIIPEGTLPAGLALSLDARVIAFTMLVTLATGLLFGLVPAWKISRHAGSRGVTSSNSKLLGGLAMAQIALAVIVVTGAGLLLRTLDRIGRIDLGFHATRVLTMRMTLPVGRYPDQDHLRAFYDAAQRAIDTVPGVGAASFAGSLPLRGWEIGQGYSVVGEATPEGVSIPAAHYQIVGARYFETLGIPLEAGRAFDNRDTKSSAQVAIVNQEFVRRHLAGRNPVGAHIRINAMGNLGLVMVEREIVGVAGQVKVGDPVELENAVEVYVPVTQNPWYGPSLAIRTEADPLALTAAVKAAIAKVDPDLALTHIATMDQISHEASARPRLRAQILAGFAGLALLLSALGVFGVLAFAVAQRRREFGIRMALGAQMDDVLGLVLCRGLVIAGGGVAAGLLGAMVLTPALGSLLFNVPPLDPVAFSAAAAALAGVALAAATIPAFRAARIDPVITLRDE